MDTPCQALSTKIVAKLIEEGLIAPNNLGKLEPNLAAGKTNVDDWRLLVELSSPPEQKDETTEPKVT